MFRRFLGVASAVLVLTGGLVALQDRTLTANATLKSIDAANGTMVVNANGQERQVTFDKSLKVLDAKGQDLADGVKSKELKEGAEVTITVEPSDGAIILKTLRLGHGAGGRPPSRPADSGAGSGGQTITANGTLKKIDAGNGMMIVFANGQDRNLRIDKSLRVLDAKGQDLADGLKSKDLKEGADVTITVELGGGGPVLKSLKLGHSAANSPPNRPAGGGTATGGKTSVGFKPLTEMSASDKYKGEDGGLYGGGKNEPPTAHQEAAKKETAKIVPLDADGKPSSNGKIVLISISMSNATQEFSKFKQIADADPQKSKQLVVVDCAQGGQAMAQWVPPNARPWEVAEQRLRDAGVSNKQVQVCWVKLANAGPHGDLAEHGKKLEADTLAVVQNAKTRFPNLRIAYLSSRIYGGYSDRPLNPEPFAYEGAFAVRWLIQDQIKGNAALNFDSSKGAAKAPLLLWGPYLWADGTTPRKSDGLVWERTDLSGDGTHPSEAGRQKVAEMILKFFKTDENATTWFVGGRSASGH